MKGCEEILPQHRFFHYNLNASWCGLGLNLGSRIISRTVELNNDLQKQNLELDNYQTIYKAAWLFTFTVAYTLYKKDVIRHLTEN